MEIIDSGSTQDNIIAPVNHAGFLLRFVAYFIDRLVVGFVTFVVLAPVFAIMGIGLYSMGKFTELRNFESMDQGDRLTLIFGLIAAYSILIIVAVMINWLYYSLMESSKRQATLGKMAVSIKVTDMKGQRISFVNATGRYFGKILSGLMFGVGYLMIIFTKNKQGLHDILANTLVVRQ